MKLKEIDFCKHLKISRETTSAKRTASSKTEKKNLNHLEDKLLSTSKSSEKTRTENSTLKRLRDSAMNFSEMKRLLNSSHRRATNSTLESQA